MSWRKTIIALMLCSITTYAIATGLRSYANPKPADQFSLYDLKGNPHHIPEFKNKAYLISFWATWCAPCLKEMPALEQAAETLDQDGIVVLTINTGDTKQDIERLIERMPISLPILMDHDSAIMSRWKVLALPTTFIINRQGMIVARTVGILDWNAPVIIEQIRTLATTPYIPETDI